MVATFCGQKRLLDIEMGVVNYKLYEKLKELVKSGIREFWLCEESDFEILAARNLKELQKYFSNIKIVLVTHLKKVDYCKYYFFDDIKFCTKSKENTDKLLIDSSDIFICYLKFEKEERIIKMLDYAHEKKKEILLIDV